jgi:hypothetical protein
MQLGDCELLKKEVEPLVYHVCYHLLCHFFNVIWENQKMNISGQLINIIRILALLFKK